MALQFFEHNLLEWAIIAAIVAAASLAGFYINRLSIRRRQRRVLEALRNGDRSAGAQSETPQDVE